MVQCTVSFVQESRPRPHTRTLRSISYKWWKELDAIIENKGLVGEDAVYIDQIHPVELEGTILS